MTLVKIMIFETLDIIQMYLQRFIHKRFFLFCCDSKILIVAYIGLRKITYIIILYTQ